MILKIGEYHFAYSKYLDQDLDVAILTARPIISGGIVREIKNTESSADCRFHIVSSKRWQFYYFISKALFKSDKLVKYKIWQKCIKLILSCCGAGRYLNNICKKHGVTHIHASYCDYDSCCLLAVVCRWLMPNMPLVFSYKEHRLKESNLERLAFKLASIVNVTTQYEKVYFESKYRFKSRCIVFDIDAMGLIHVKKFIQSKPTSRRARDIAILSGRVTDYIEKRSGSRYNYVEMVDRLCSRGLTVSLFTNMIYEKSSGYRILKDKYPNFEICRPLDFDGSPAESYKLLGDFRYGILHNTKGENPSDVKEFFAHNIPNRLYRYITAGVIPVISEECTALVELNTSFQIGIIIHSADDLFEKTRTGDLGDHIQAGVLRSAETYTFRVFSEKVAEFLGKEPCASK